MLNRLKNLITVKSLVTLPLTGAFIYLSVIGTISGTEFLVFFTTVIAFYFGTQTNKIDEK